MVKNKSMDNVSESISLDRSAIFSQGYLAVSLQTQLK